MSTRRRLAVVVAACAALAGGCDHEVSKPVVLPNGRPDADALGACSPPPRGDRYPVGYFLWGYAGQPAQHWWELRTNGIATRASREPGFVTLVLGGAREYGRTHWPRTELDIQHWQLDYLRRAANAGLRVFVASRGAPDGYGVSASRAVTQLAADRNGDIAMLGPCMTGDTNRLESTLAQYEKATHVREPALRFIIAAGDPSTPEGRFVRATGI